LPAANGRVVLLAEGPVAGPAEAVRQQRVHAQLIEGVEAADRLLRVEAIRFGSQPRLESVSDLGTGPDGRNLRFQI
jgi:hypothetical protein